MLKDLYKKTYQLGYNDRDNPTEIPFDSGQVQENMFPGAPAPRPRHGISAWNSNAIPLDIVEIIPWDSEELIFYAGGDFYYIAPGSGSYTLLLAAGLAADVKIRWTRVRDFLLIITDDNENPSSYIISKDDADTLVARNGNIVHENPLLTVTPVLPGNISADAYVNYTITWVNRDDPDSVDGGGDPKLVELDTGAFNPGVLESSPNSTLFDFGAGGTPAAFKNDIGMTLGIPAALDSQATHWRIYRSEEADSATAASALTKRWIADVPAKGPNQASTYTDNFTNAQVAGSLDTLKVGDYDTIPSGTAILYHQGRLWIGGAVKAPTVETRKKRGRWFYSELPLDVEWPDKWVSLFNETSYFKDTSLNDLEDGTNLSLHENDLIFINSVNTAWRLRNGDADLEPENISTSKGSDFRFGAVRADHETYALTVEGPAVVGDRTMNPLEGFTDKNVWPTNWKGDVGKFFSADPEEVRCFYFRNTWWVASECNFIGMYMPDDKKSFGPIKIKPAHTNIRFKRAAVLSPTKCVILSVIDGTSYLWDFLDPNTYLDNGTEQTLYFKSKHFYVNKQDPDLVADFWSIIMYARFTDQGGFAVSLTTDYFRLFFQRLFSQLTESESSQLNSTLLSQFAQERTLSVPDGIYGRTFTIEWWKRLSYPFDIEQKGFKVKYHRISGFDYENLDNLIATADYTVTPSIYPPPVLDMELWLLFDECAGDIIYDVSGKSRHHTYSASGASTATFDKNLIPGGGRNVVYAADTALYTLITGPTFPISSLGIEDDGPTTLVSTDLAFEYIDTFPDVGSSDQVIVENGDATNGYRFQVKTDGSLHFEIWTAAHNYVYKSAAGVVVQGAKSDYATKTQYIAFSLTSGGTVGRFMYGLISGGDGVDVATTRTGS